MNQPQSVNTSKDNGLHAICGFFNEATLKINKNELKKRYDVITFNNVLANISSPQECLRLAKSILKNEDSRIIIQTGYHPKQFSSGLFDYIYHEHYSYFNIKSMEILCKKTGLIVEKSEKLSLRGGSIRFYLKAATTANNSKVESESIVYERFNCI